MFFNDFGLNYNFFFQWVRQVDFCYREKEKKYDYLMASPYEIIQLI